MFNPNLTLIPIVTNPPQKWGDRHLKIDQGILNKARMNKHTYEAYKDMIKVEIKLIQLCLRSQDREAEGVSKNRTFAKV
jgi:hypothetical protein